MVWPDYGQLSQLLMLFGQNVAVGMMAVIAYAALGDLLDRRRAAFKSVLAGFLFGCSALVSMNFPIHTASGETFDARSLFVLVGSLSADPLAAAIAVALPLFYRLELGGPQAALGVAGILSAGLIGFLVRRHYRERVRDFGVGQLALVGLVYALVSIMWARGIFPIPGQGPFPVDRDIGSLLIFPAATALLGSAMSMTYYRVWRRTRSRLVEVLETASDLVWETDASNRLTFMSDRFLRMLGFEASELLGRNLDLLGGQWSDQATRAVHVSAIAAHEPFGELAYIPPTKDGSRKLLSISGRPHRDAQGRFLGYRGIAADVTDRERWRTALATISSRVGDAVGEEFLRSLTRSVGDVLGADWAFLARYDAEGQRLESLVRLAEGKFVENYNIPLDNIPASEVIKGQALIVPSGMAQRFPRHAEITGVKAEAYAGMPLVGSRGEVLGILSVAFRNPLQSGDVESVLRMFAGRAAAEIERTKIEEALRRSLAASVRAQRIGKIGSAEIDLVHDKAVWSDEQCRIYGLSPAAGTPSMADYIQFVHPDDRESVRKARELDALGQAAQPIEFRIVRPNGEERWVHREVEVERDEAGVAIGLFTIQQDITERRRMEESLRLSAQHLASAQRVGKMASIEIDMATRRGTWSSEAFRLFGSDPATGQPGRGEFLKLIHPDDRALMSEAWRRELEDQDTEPFEYRLLQPDGGVRWIFRQRDTVRDATGKPQRLIITHQDITDREKMRREMAEVLAALNIARDGVILTDDQRRIVYANSAVIDLLGLPERMSEIEGKTLRDLQPSAEFLALSEEILAGLQSGNQWQGSGTWTRPSDGNPLLFDARVHRLPNGGIVIVVADAGVRMRAETEERRRQEWQAQASKLEALGNLAGGIAHDFNNLLGAILGFGQFLVEDLEPATEPRHFAERIVAVSQRGRSFVQQILSFSRRSPVESVEVNLAEAVGEAHELLTATLPVTTALVLDIRAEDAAVLADKGQVVQILVNLCGNASDALMGEPGTVTITVADTAADCAELAHLPSADGQSSPAGVAVWSMADGEGWMATGTKPSGPCVSVMVADTGSGIPEAVRKQIFEPFFTTKDRGRGTGLGLAVVQRIVLEHGGAILVRTRMGGGTSFELLLPVIDARVSADSGIDDALEFEARDVSKTSILVVDDDESFCAMVDTALRRSGYRVQSTNDPRVAMAWVKRHAEAWDILVTDQSMPFVKGEELVRYFKAHSPSTRSIICTGYSSDMTEQRARAAGAEALLLKPFEFERLEALVSRLAQDSGAANH